MCSKSYVMQKRDFCCPYLVYFLRCLISGYTVTGTQCSEDAYFLLAFVFLPSFEIGEVSLAHGEELLEGSVVQVHLADGGIHVVRQHCSSLHLQAHQE